MKLITQILIMLALTGLAACDGMVPSEQNDDNPNKREDGKEEANEAANTDNRGQANAGHPQGVALAPKITCRTPTNLDRPMWSWVSGGNGNGKFRYRLGNQNSKWTATNKTAFRPTRALGDGRHTLYVQEQDKDSLWSPIASFQVVIDTTPPNKPVVSAPSITNDTTPTFSWTSGGGGNGRYRLYIDDEKLSEFAIETSRTSFTSEEVLSEGLHTLYITELDELGNPSPVLSFPFTVDTTSQIALLDGFPVGRSSVTSISVHLSSNNGVTGYRFKVGAESAMDCASESGYSEAYLGLNEISADISAIEDGPVMLCVLAVDSAGNVQALHQPTAVSWLKDTEAPTVAAVYLSELSNAVHLKWEVDEMGDSEGYLIARAGQPINWEPSTGVSYTEGLLDTEGVTILTTEEGNLGAGHHYEYKDSTVVNGNTYYYKFYAFDIARNYSEQKSQQATPFDMPSVVKTYGGALADITDLALSGNLAIAVSRGTDDATAIALDVTNLPNIVEKGSIALGVDLLALRNQNAIALKGSKLLVLGETEGVTYLKVYDFSNPDSPAHVGTLQLENYPKSVRFVTDHIAFIGHGCDGIHVVSLADPANPSIVNTVLPYDRNEQSCVSSLSIQGSKAYAASNSSISAFDITVPADPTLQTTSLAYRNSTLSLNDMQLVADGTKIIAMERFSTGLPSLVTIDAEDPSALIAYASEQLNINGYWSLSSLLLKHNLAYVVDGSTTHVVNVRHRESPQVAGTFEGALSAVVNGDYIIFGTLGDLKVVSGLPLVEP